MAVDCLAELSVRVFDVKALGADRPISFQCDAALAAFVRESVHYTMYA